MVGLTAQPVADFITVILAVALYFKLSKEFPKENENNGYMEINGEYVWVDKFDD